MLAGIRGAVTTRGRVRAETVGQNRGRFFFVATVGGASTLDRMGESWPAGRGGLPRGWPGRAAGLLLALLVAVWADGAESRGRRVVKPRPVSRPARSIESAKSGESPWLQVDRLIAVQRLQEAIKLLLRIQKTAQTAGQEVAASRAAVRLSQVRMTLSNYELAVTVLQDQLTWQAQLQRQTGEPMGAPEPAIELSRATLAMFYAQALRQYAQMYSFQVGQRERVAEAVAPEMPFVSTLRGWTAKELFTQAQAALTTAWERRVVLGEQPVTALPEYVEPGTLPREARPTLRDLLTYQYVELLAQQQHWRADQRLGIPTSQLAALAHLDGAEAVASADRLLDAEVHPLIKLAAVLGDLAAWHQAAGRSAAAVEAKLERLVRLHQAFTDEPRRAEGRAQLAELVQQSGELAQGASAQATLAELMRTDFLEHPDRAAADQLTRASAIAAQGAQRFPESPGGKRCRAIVQALGAPEFHLASSGVDGAGKRSLRVEHRNLSALYFRAYKFDPVQRLLAGSAEDLRPPEREVATLLRSAKPVAAWTTPLPATPDLQSQVTPVVPPLEELGGYLIVASARADFALTNNQLEGVRLQLSELVLWATGEAAGVRVTAVSGRTGEPLVGVELSLYQLAGSAAGSQRRAMKVVQSARTGPDGSAALPYRGAESDLVVIWSPGCPNGVPGRPTAGRARAPRR